MSEWRELAPLGDVRRIMGPGGVVQYETRPGETAREALQRGTIVALVALCEEVVEELAGTVDDEHNPPYGERRVAPYRARLEQLKGEA
jgi:hypothetical protein